MKLDWKRERLWFALTGIALAAAGYLRYATQDVFTWASKGLVAAGVLLFVVSLALSYRELGVFFGRRSSKLGVNTFTISVLVIVFLGIVNYLGAIHHKRVDLTTEKLYTLSDQSRKVVTGLQQDIQVTRFAKQPDASVKDTVTEYVNLGPHVHYREIDPEAKPEVARQYNVTHLNTVVVSAGSHNETLEGTGEQDITNAILKVTRDTVKTICFVEGHGEKALAGTDQDGLGNMNTSLKGEGYVTKTVNLVSSGLVPAECSVLVEAGPKQPLFPQEADMIAKYLQGGGKALLMLDPEVDSKLDSVLQVWNINVGSNVVIDASGVGRMFGTGPAVPLVIDYGASPITQNFKGTMTFFPLARTVSIADKNKTDVSAIELLKTSERSFTIPNLKTKEVRFDPKTDTPGPLSLGVTAERGAGPAAGSVASRLAVIGDSAFATNQWAGLQRNGDLFQNIVSWLAQDENLISIRPKNPTARHVIITETQQRELFFATMFFLPGLVILSGAFIWLRRR